MPIEKQSRKSFINIRVASIPGQQLSLYNGRPVDQTEHDHSTSNKDDHQLSGRQIPHKSYED